MCKVSQLYNDLSVLYDSQVEVMFFPVNVLQYPFRAWNSLIDLFWILLICPSDLVTQFCTAVAAAAAIQQLEY